MPQNCPIFITWQLGDNVALQKRTKYSTIKDSCNAMYDPSTVSLISLRRTFNSKISHTTRNQFLQTPASDETPKRIYPLWKWHRCWLKTGNIKKQDCQSTLNEMWPSAHKMFLWWQTKWVCGLSLREWYWVLLSVQMYSLQCLWVGVDFYARPSFGKEVSNSRQIEIVKQCCGGS